MTISSRCAQCAAECIQILRNARATHLPGKGFGDGKGIASNRTYEQVCLSCAQGIWRGGIYAWLPSGSHGPLSGCAGGVWCVYLRSWYLCVMPAPQSRQPPAGSTKCEFSSGGQLTCTSGPQGTLINRACARVTACIGSRSARLTGPGVACLNWRRAVCGAMHLLGRSWTC